MQQAAAVCGHIQPKIRKWDGSVTSAIEASFVEAIKAWQLEVEAGGYGPKFLGSLAAVNTGQIGAAATQPCNAGSSRSSSLRGVTSAPAFSNGLTAVPAVFEGIGDDAMQALEALVLDKLVQKPCLTVMQLQQGIQAISQLDSPFQLAAISVLLQAGFWMAAMQVALADFALLADVLTEVRGIIELGSQWSSLWAGIDRDLFLRTFRGVGLISQYLHLKRQLAKAQDRGMSQGQPKQMVAGPSRYSGSRRSGRLSQHPDLATAERRTDGTEGMALAATGSLAPQVTGRELQQAGEVPSRMSSFSDSSYLSSSRASGDKDNMSAASTDNLGEGLAEGSGVPDGQAADELNGKHESAVMEEEEEKEEEAEEEEAEELRRAMQMFQQRLDETAVMAQLLMEQQVVGLSARCIKDTTLPTEEAPSLSQGLAGLAAPLGFDEASTAEEVAEYARYLGMDPEQDANLMYIAEMALSAACPDGWTIHLDGGGNEYFYNAATQTSSYEHPMDKVYKSMYQEKKQQQLQALSRAG
eukprot:gene5746-5986_t